LQHSTGGYWPINPTEIFLKDKWNTENKDVAIFRIKSTGRYVAPLPLKFALPSNPKDKLFKILGYPAHREDEPSDPAGTFDEPSQLTLPGAATVEGSNCRGRNYELAGQYDHGMSGGPVIFDGDV